MKSQNKKQEKRKLYRVPDKVYCRACKWRYYESGKHKYKPQNKLEKERMERNLSPCCGSIVIPLKVRYETAKSMDLL